MRILITGAGGNIGRGLVERLAADGRHRLVLSDIVQPRWLAEDFEVVDSFQPLDVQVGFGLESAARGCDLIVHLPAWHGVHSRSRTEADFWRLNVDGTFWMLQAARSEGVGRVVFMSSQSWHHHYDKYGFTKRVGEELMAYHHAEHGVAYVSIRPHDLTPWQDDWPQRYGARLLYGGVDRDDVLDAVLCSIDHLDSHPEAELVLDATRPNVFSDDQLQHWAEDPVARLDAIFPGAADAVARYGLDITKKPQLVPEGGRRETGYAPSRHFGTFLEHLRAMTPEQARAVPSHY